MDAAAPKDTLVCWTSSLAGWKNIKYSCVVNSQHCKAESSFYGELNCDVFLLQRPSCGGRLPDEGAGGHLGRSVRSGVLPKREEAAPEANVSPDFRQTAGLKLRRSLCLPCLFYWPFTPLTDGKYRIKYVCCHTTVISAEMNRLKLMEQTHTEQQTFHSPWETMRDTYLNSRWRNKPRCSLLMQSQPSLRVFHVSYGASF